MVLDAGNIVSPVPISRGCPTVFRLFIHNLYLQQVEFDRPSELLKREGGFLKSLVDESGDSDALYAAAVTSS